MTSDHTNVELSLRVNGDKVAEYHHDGRVYVEAKEGSTYAIHLRNNNPYRVKVVVSVDGVSVITGKPADTNADDAGYLINAHDNLVIKGYRLDNDNVAAFQFTKAEGSYAKAEKDMNGTTGVIGVRVYREALPPPRPVVKEIHHHHHHKTYWWEWPNPYPYTDVYYRYRGAARGTAYSSSSQNLLRSINSQNVEPQGVYACSSSTEATSDLDATPFDMGSTFGAKTESRVVETTFKVDACLGELALYYASRAGLKVLGIDLSRTQKVSFPEPFGGKYAKPPANWQG